MSEASKNNAENTLAAFAIEPLHDKATLDSYLRSHPELTDELLDLALELELADIGAEDEQVTTSSAAVDAAWALFSNPATTKPTLMTEQFNMGVAKALGIKSSAIAGLRDRKVQSESLPIGFLVRLSNALESPMDAVLDYLAGSPRLPLGASFKADERPETSSKIPLEQLLRECGHTPDEINTILQSK
ncbi:hypothetical protein [Paracoccus aestuariivivens]|uniref:Uncharacterized protein n=1 Tax=Paracoccus aestuariivivens TaxID=1820333 RepID=A0A6L6JG23_9RHOB|nr:hypothetical protein [Paracoccus aestuariivivens]MTH80138.1 hypothetical protein [Paracoccus aestuariivivens]